MARKKQLRAEFLVANGLDPRTIYPKCDVCSNRGGTRQVGRWWVHDACGQEPLATLRLPRLNYLEVRRRTPSRTIVAMLMKLTRVRHAKLQTLREAWEEL